MLKFKQNLIKGKYQANHAASFVPGTMWYDGCLRTPCDILSSRAHFAPVLDTALNGILGLWWNQHRGQSRKDFEGGAAFSCRCWE
jgi:hypothetical protein